MKTEFYFLDSPLCTWARLVLAEAKLDYEKFPSGEYFYQILKRSDPRLQNSNSNLPNEYNPPPPPPPPPPHPPTTHNNKYFNASNSSSSSSNQISSCNGNSSNFESNHYDTTYRSRLLNLDFILRNIRSFYQEILNHILLIKLPDIYQIAKHPYSEETFKEMEKMLLLLMGLAINGEFKAKFIEQIQQQLETQTQMQLIPFIQLVTEDLSFSISCTLSSKLLNQSASSNLNDSNECQETLGSFINNKLMPNIQRVIDERDSYLESIIELEQDKDYLLFKLNNSGNTINQCNSINGGLNSNNSISQDKDVNSAGCSQSAVLAGQSATTCNNNNNNNNNINNGNTNANSDLKHMSINELILNLVNNSNTICKLETCSSSNLVNDSLLNETNLISKLIDSIINNENGSLAHQSMMMNQNDSVNNDDNSSGSSSQNTSTANLMARNSNDNHVHILNDLKNRKSLTNNWNQKIAIELVECKIRLKQLINEMYVTLILLNLLLEILN